MASVTDTAIAETGTGPPAASAAIAAPVVRGRSPAPPSPEEGARPGSQSGGSQRGAEVGRHAATRRWPVSPLTRRIIAVNVLPLALLAVGFLYLGKFEGSLIGQQVESLRTQGEIFAAALSEGAVLDSADEGPILLPDLSRQMMRRLVEPTRTRARLFDIEGKPVADSRLLRGPGDGVQVIELPPPDDKGLFGRFVDRLYDGVAQYLPSRRTHPLYHEGNSAEDYAEALRALRGESGSAVRSDVASGGLVVSVAVPVQRYKKVLGAVMLSSGSGDIEAGLRTVRLELLRIFAVALLVTVGLSFYLAGTIVRPLRRLAAVAQRARGRGARVEIPDLTDRNDEIGELSGSLREMTDTVWQRMSAIESFAADVAHEIKNPLSSLRSAVETAARIEDPVKQRRLMAIILDDVERLDRLITDISDASRLDAELSRLEVAPSDIGAMLRALADIHETAHSEGGPRLVLELPSESAGRARPLIVPGIESRLSQVFVNLIANAVSFSPAGGDIAVRASHDGRGVLVRIEDDGPGIPEDRLAAIFDRFYSERPAGEKFGTHSGLGLAISKQIVEAHRGRIWAENRKDAAGAACGARFSVRLPAGP